MSESLLRVVVAVVLILHGVGHLLAIFPIVGKKLSQTHSADSWLFTRLLGDTGARIIGVVIWLIACIGFIGAGLGLLGWLVPSELWPALATWASIFSLLGLGLFWNAFPFLFPNKLGVIIIDVAVLVYLLWLR